VEALALECSKSAEALVLEHSKSVEALATKTL